MRRIHKRPEAGDVACLAEARATRDLSGGHASSADWAIPDKACKDALRKALWEDQHGLCCYCCDRIPTSPSKIEHAAPRSAAPERCLDWDNLLLACTGEGPIQLKPNHRTCDTARGEKALHHHPGVFPPDVSTQFRYRPRSGKVVGETPEAEADIDTLNLNAKHLVQGRRNVVEALSRFLESKRFRPGAIQQLLDDHQPRPGQQLPAFQPVAVQYLQSKLAAR